MSKEIFRKNYLEKLDANFPYLEPYFNDSLIMLAAINPIKSQLINCLMIEQFIASINCTNHFLERLMKLSLIVKEVEGLNYNDTEELTKKLDLAYKNHDRLDLRESIKKCYEEFNLITKEESESLQIIRKSIRNSYSHAQMDEINSGLPKTIPVFKFNLNKATHNIKSKEALKKHEVFIPIKSPSLQSYFQYDNAKELAINYFKTVYQIAKNIDKKLNIK